MRSLLPQRSRQVALALVLAFITLLPATTQTSTSASSSGYELNDSHGAKYHGFSFDAEYYWRWLNNFVGTGVAGLPEIRNHGFQLQASAMAIPKTLQFYSGGSMVLSNLGGGYDTRVGLNWFPFKNKVVRWNTEGLLLYRSPVGYTSVPYNVGSTGFVFHTNLEMAF